MFSRLGKGIAKGADGWSPREFALLPDSWLDVLGSMVGRWEAGGHSPEALRNVIFSMIPKPKAETETGLRPIGLFPCVYRAWMVIRKRQCNEWPLQLRDGHVGAAALAATTRASTETQHYHGEHSLLAFVDCSKCYERAGHALAGQRAFRSGLAVWVANMVFDAHKGHRHIKVYGAVARPRTGGNGLVAGCVFAKDILKAFWRRSKNNAPEAGHGTMSMTSPPPGERTNGGTVCGQDAGTQAQERLEEGQRGIERR